MLGPLVPLSMLLSVALVLGAAAALASADILHMKDGRQVEGVVVEETDALVIIVSEERATVSVVERGEIRPTSDANELREVLQERLQVIDDASPDAEGVG